MQTRTILISSRKTVQWWACLFVVIVIVAAPTMTEGRYHKVPYENKWHLGCGSCSPSSSCRLLAHRQPSINLGNNKPAATALFQKEGEEERGHAISCPPPITNPPHRNLSKQSAAAKAVLGMVPRGGERYPGGDCHGLELLFFRRLAYRLLVEYLAVRMVFRWLCKTVEFFGGGRYRLEGYHGFELLVYTVALLVGQVFALLLESLVLCMAFQTCCRICMNVFHPNVSVIIIAFFTTRALWLLKRLYVGVVPSVMKKEILICVFMIAAAWWSIILKSRVAKEPILTRSVNTGNTSLPTHPPPASAYEQ